MSDLWLFDNDGTLYDDGAAYSQFVDLLLAFILSMPGIDETSRQQLILALKNKKAVTATLFALCRDHGLDFNKTVDATFLKIDLGQCQLVSPDLVRKRGLENIQAEKVVFTNNASAYARQVLRYVGLETCFSRIIGVQEMGGLSKSDLKAFQFVQKLFPGREIYFCDDKREFLDPARGWAVLLVPDAVRENRPTCY